MEEKMLETNEDIFDEEVLTTEQLETIVGGDGVAPPPDPIG